MPSFTVRFAAILGLVVLACGHESASVELTEPWSSFQLPIADARVVESTPTQLTIELRSAPAPAEHLSLMRSPFHLALERRLERLWYRGSIGVDNSFFYYGDRGAGLTVRYAAAGSRTRVSFSLDGEHVAPPRIRVAWDGEASVYDVLGRTEEGPPRAVMVPRRPASATGTRQVIGGYTVRTQCGPDHCLDGLEREDPAGSHAVVLVATDPTPDEIAVLADEAEGSWVERGIGVVSARDGYVSYYRATASFAEGAARSNAELSCRTLMPPMPMPTSLGGPYASREARALNDAIRWFVEDEREAGELRADGLTPPGELDFLLTAEPDALVFCLSNPAAGTGGSVQLVRATLLDR